MQPGTCNADYDWTEEQYDVTFQIALIGCDGLVVGSDRLSVQTVPSETGGPAFGQPTYQTKYCLDDTQSIICFWAGGAMSPVVARQIATSCKLQDAELQWSKSIDTAAASIPVIYQYPIDQVIVAKADTPDAVWLVTRRWHAFENKFVPVCFSVKIADKICTGVGTVAQFLPHHLWRPNMSVSQLRTLALLTLSYATEENPSSVGPPFDIMTLDRTGHVSWLVHDRMIHQTFQADLEKIFSDRHNSLENALYAV
jgi:hypothetical protein